VEARHKAGHDELSAALDWQRAMRTNIVVHIRSSGVMLHACDFRLRKRARIPRSSGHCSAANTPTLHWRIFPG
jgi:hypothetical protein